VAGVVSVLGAGGGAAVPLGVLDGVCCGVPLGVLDGTPVTPGMGAASTSFDRVRGRAPPPFSPVVEFVTGATAAPFVRISAVELDSPVSPFTLMIKEMGAHRFIMMNCSLPFERCTLLPRCASTTACQQFWIYPHSVHHNKNFSNLHFRAATVSCFCR
jgi:hypothetical protein